MSEAMNPPLRRVATALFILGVAALAGLRCSGSGTAPAEVRKAERVLLETSAANPQYAAYVLPLAANSASPVARELILEYASSPHHATALEALRALSARPLEEDRARLQSAFEQRRGALKLQAAMGLVRLGDPAALDWLRGAVSDGGVTFSIAATRLLAEQGEQELLEPLFRKQMKSKDPAIRDEAYVVLGEIRQRWGTGLLLEGLDQEFGERRQQAIEALGRSGDAEVAPRLMEFANTQGLVFATIEALGALGNPKAVGPIRKLTAHAEEAVRVFAGAALWRLGESATAEETLRPLGDASDPTIRRVLAEQLAPVEAPEATAMLVRLVGDADKSVQIAALRALDRREPGTVRAALVAALADPDYEVVTLALNDLTRAGDRASLAAIEPLMDHENPYVALAAADAVLSIDAAHPAQGG